MSIPLLSAYAPIGATMRLVIAIFLLLPISKVAEAECNFRIENSIVCTTPMSAALVWQKFGENTTLTNVSYNRQIMREAGCGRPYGKTFAKIKISQINTSRIATPSGWENIVAISANGHDLWFVSQGYLIGACTKYVPVNGNNESLPTWVESANPAKPREPTVTHYATPTTTTP